jgi:tripartite-type tricarboxylate transporter receptor subunit TctC
MISHTRQVALKAVVWGALLTMVVAALTPTLSRADGYPSGNVRIVVPFSPGAAVDVVARMIANGLSEQSGKTVIVENRPGGATVVGAESVAQSEPDGHTLLFMPDDTFTILPHVSKNMRFDPNKQLTPVIGVANIINILVANPTISPKTLPELIDYARAHPGELKYGSNGFGSAAQIAIETLKSRAKLDILHVPYKGNAPALMATVSGEVQLMAIGYGTARALIEESKLRAIAVAGPDREPGLPNLPTTAELGYPDVDVTTRLMMSVTAKTSPDVVQQAADAISRLLKKPEMQKHIEARGVVVTNIGPKEFAHGMAQRYQFNAKAVRVSGARLD